MQLYKLMGWCPPPPPSHARYVNVQHNDLNVATYLCQDAVSCDYNYM